ncbi:MAG TPA: hypothetical protein VND64_29935 [Pirellulales bacterium]|nr:hypothetical protein [Pirellulales bacterium]
MLRALCLSMTLVVFSLGSALADNAAVLGQNAALVYWQAFATSPTLTHDEQSRLGSQCLTMPLDTQAREIVNKAAYSLTMMRRGAALPRCDWAINWDEDGIDALLPHVSAARTLSCLACLRARIHFDEGRGEEATNDVVAAMALGRHVSLDGSLIAVLVGYSIEHRTSEALALGLPKLDSEAIKDLKRRLDALPAGQSPAAALRTCEEKTLDWWVRKVVQAKDEASLLDLLTQVSDERVRDPRAKGREFLEACGGDAKGVLKFAQETRPCYELMAKDLELPLDQFEKEFEREMTKRAGNPVFKAFFPPLVKVRRTQARADVRRALLTAALAVQLEGRDALKNHPDPVVGGPFEYVTLAGGFELRSNFKDDDQPLTLTVGLRGK